MEGDLQTLLGVGRNLARVGLFGQRLLRAERLLAADRRAPEPLVDRVFHLLEVGLEAVLAEVVDLVFARQGHVARRGDDLDLGGEDLERQVEAHLVVARAGRTVGHGVGADLLGVFDDGDGLENTLRADRNGVGAVAQDVAVDHVFDALFVVFLLDVERGVLHGAQRQGAFFDVRKLLLREAARVGDGGIDIVPFILGEVFHAERGVETSAECQNYFLLSHFLISFCLFQVEQFFELVFEEHDVGRHARLYLRGFLGRVVEHTRAEAHAPVVALQDVVVATPLATPPELLVLGELGKGHRRVAHARIEFHHGQRRRNTE